MHPVTRFALGASVSGICGSVLFYYTGQLLAGVLLGTTVFFGLYSLVLALRVRYLCSLDDELESFLDDELEDQQ